MDSIPFFHFNIKILIPNWPKDVILLLFFFFIFLNVFPSVFCRIDFLFLGRFGVNALSQNFFTQTFLKKFLTTFTPIHYKWMIIFMKLFPSHSMAIITRKERIHEGQPNVGIENQAVNQTVTIFINILFANHV